MNLPYNCETLLNEVLWGNVLFTYQHVSTKHNVTLFFKNWVSSGLIYLRSLKFVNGEIDETYIYNKLDNKRNIYCEILTMKRAILPYKELLKGYTFTPIENAPDNNTTCELKKITTKEVYKKLVQKKCETPFQQKVWNRLFKTENIA